MDSHISIILIVKENLLLCPLSPKTKPRAYWTQRTGDSANSVIDDFANFSLQ